MNSRNFGIVLLVGLFAQQIIQAQETTYLSNLGTSAGSIPVGSDSRLIMAFETGINTDGYTLNSIQLEMADVADNPNGFTLKIEPAHDSSGDLPGNGTSLGIFDGSPNPDISGIYTYTPVANITLLPRTVYVIVLTAETSVADGAYEWSVGTSIPSSDYDWVAAGGVFRSNNGSPPTPYSNDGQYAINATAVPEPSALSLLSICILFLCWHLKPPNKSLQATRDGRSSSASRRTSSAPRA